MKWIKHPTKKKEPRTPNGLRPVKVDVSKREQNQNSVHIIVVLILAIHIRNEEKMKRNVNKNTFQRIKNQKFHILL